MTSRTFESAFGRPPELVVQAPGRVNLMGEHTDYNDGLVLPIALGLVTHVHVATRRDDVVRVSSESFDAISRYRLGEERWTGSFSDYVQGVTAALRARGHLIHGFDAHVDSTIPIGSGLSSSAALTVATSRALRRCFRLDLDDIGIARLCRAVENDFVGAPVGIMDPMACSLADVTSALFLDTRTLAFSRVPMPASLELVVIDSGVSHEHATGEYAVRRKETERAAELLGVTSLRDVDSIDTPAMHRLPDVLQRRVRHVVTENRRVVETASALESGAIEKLRPLFAASHASMRDDYEVSVPAVDRLVELGVADADVVGARLTGGGFGGAVVMLARTGRASAVAQRVVSQARGARVLVPTTATST